MSSSLKNGDGAYGPSSIK